MQLGDVREARRFGPGINVAGTGNDVIWYHGSKPAIATATFTGHTKFIVRTYGEPSGIRIIFNESETSSAQASLNSGTLVGVVNAEGPWRFEIN